MAQAPTTLAQLRTAQPSLYVPTPEQLRLQQLRTATEIKATEQTGKIERIEKRKAYFWFFLAGMLITWFIVTFVKVSRKWSYMIKQIKKAKEQGSKFDKSGLFIAFVLEYPIFARLRIANAHLPEAIKLSYYSAATTQQMGTGYSSDGKDYLSMLDEASQKCSPDSPDWCSATAIWCSVFPRTPGGDPRADCFPPCNNPVYTDAALDYTSKITGWGTTLGFAGHLGGNAFKGTEAAGKASPLWGGLGFAIGAGIGVWQAYQTHSEQVQKCREGRANCYAAPGTPSC